MKFGELMEVFNGWRIRVIRLTEGGEATEEISLLNTVGAYDRLARYRDAKVVRFSTTQVLNEDKEFYVDALEVVVDG